MDEACSADALEGRDEEDDDWQDQLLMLVGLLDGNAVAMVETDADDD